MRPQPTGIRLESRRARLFSALFDVNTSDLVSRRRRQCGARCRDPGAVPVRTCPCAGDPAAGSSYYHIRTYTLGAPAATQAGTEKMRTGCPRRDGAGPAPVWRHAGAVAVAGSHGGNNAEGDTRFRRARRRGHGPDGGRSPGPNRGARARGVHQVRRRRGSDVCSGPDPPRRGCEESAGARVPDDGFRSGESVGRHGSARASIPRSESQ